MTVEVKYDWSPFLSRLGVESHGDIFGILSRAYRKIDAEIGVNINYLLYHDDEFACLEASQDDMNILTSYLEEDSSLLRVTEDDEYLLEDELSKKN